MMSNVYHSSLNSSSFLATATGFLRARIAASISTPPKYSFQFRTQPPLCMVVRPSASIGRQIKWEGTVGTVGAVLGRVRGLARF